MKIRGDKGEGLPIEKNKYTLFCPHCKSPVEEKYALRSSRSEPMTCRQCASPSWFRAPNGLAPLTLILIATAWSLPEFFGWIDFMRWAFVAIATPLVVIADRYLTLRFGHMVKASTHPVGKFRSDSPQKEIT